MHLFRLLVVEDEAIIRNGLTRQIPWPTYGFEAVGEAADGAEGLRLARRLHPDVVLTDIRMPGMDGIELMRRLRRLLPDVRIVVLSGYGDFEYAQKAIEYGASAYLLKPTSDAAFSSAFAKLHAEMEKERERRAQVRELRDKLFEDLVTGRYTDEDRPRIERILAETGVRADDRFALLKVRLEFPEGRPIPRDLLRDVRLCLPAAGEEAVDAIDIDPDPVYTVILEWRPDGRPRDERREEARIEAVAQRLREALRERLAEEDAADGTIGMGASAVHAGIYEFRRCYYEAAIALGYRFFLGPQAQTLHLYRGTGAPPCAPPAVPAAADGGKPLSNPCDENESRIQEALAEAVLSLNLKGALAAVDRHFDRLRAIGNPDPEFLYLKTLELLLSAANRIRERSHDVRDLFYSEAATALRPLLVAANAAGTREKMALLVEEMIRRVAEKDREKQGAAGGIEQVKAYIREHCGRRLPLEEAAHVLFMNPTYFSSYFRQKTGTTYIEFVTSVRIARARELLRDPDIRVYEVANRVGYEDFRHFSRIFRRHVGVGPIEYRDRILGRKTPPA